MPDFQPGCLSRRQIDDLHLFLDQGWCDPSRLSDLEGCGPVSMLEAKLVAAFGSRYALAVSSGTAALHAALLAAGVGSGDEVVVTSYTWPQSMAPILFCGAIPVFADISPETLTLDPDSVASRIGPRTRAIVVVQIFGHMADMARLQDLARSRGLTLIADAAHAPGAQLGGKPVGAWGDMVCLSFGRGKAVSAGEGGALLVNHDHLYEQALRMTQHTLRVLRALGPSAAKSAFGLNYRLHPLLACLTMSSLEELPECLMWREQNRQEAAGRLSHIPGLRLQASIPSCQPAPYGLALTADSDAATGEWR